MSEINPGIRQVVKLLNQHGFTTVDSGDGETHDYECDRKHGYVVSIVQKELLIQEADRLASVLREHGLTPTQQDIEPPKEGYCVIQASYDPMDGIAILDLSYVHDRMIMEKE